MNKFLISDYDKTFYINDEDIKRNKVFVEKFMSIGNIFVIATGRSFFDFQTILNQYHFQYNYVILNNGATILDKENHILQNVSIPNKIILKLKKDLNLEMSVSYFCCSGLESRVSFNHNNLTKINVRYEDKEIAKQKAKVLKQKYKNEINIYYVGSNSIEIISSKINKAEAIKFLTKKYSEDDLNIYTIGDSYNDIEMIKRFDGYCMVESIEEIKQYAIREYMSVSNLIEDILNNKI